MQIASDSQKPLLLIFPHNLLSHYTRCLVLCRELRQHYRIKFLYSEEYAAFIEEEGFDVFHCESLNAEELNRKFSKMNFTWLNIEELGSVLEEQIRTIRQLQADFVLGDASFTLRMASEVTGVPMLSLFNGYMSKYYSGIRMPYKNFPAYHLLKQLPEKVLNNLVRYGEGLTFRLIHEPFNKLRAKYNLQPKTNFLDELEGDVNLICDLNSVFPQSGLPANYFHVGPLYYTSPQLMNQPDLQLHPDKKTILVSMGSSGDWSSVEFLNQATFKKYNIVTAGDRNSVIAGYNVYNLSFFKPEHILPFVDVFICHGGNGSTYQALAFGVPLLCATCHMEQNWNVQSLAREDLAICIDDLSPGEFMRALEIAFDRKYDPTHVNIMSEIRAERNRLPAQVAKVVCFVDESFRMQTDFPVNLPG